MLLFFFGVERRFGRSHVVIIDATIVSHGIEVAFIAVDVD